ncbi:MAG: T9SS type A sorting domain-containing protein [bacterium]
MKNLITIILAIILSTNVIFANNNNYKLTIANLKFSSANSLEFDIYLLNSNTDQEELKYSLGQYFLEFNPKIANGGNLICSIVASDLPETMRPRNPSVSENLLRLAVNSPSANKDNLPLIPNQKPGMLIAKVKLETSAEKFAEEPLDLKWTNEQSKWKTKVMAFNGKENYEITNAENHTSELDNSGNNAAENLTELPAEYNLSQNYPNPFNPTTNIKFDIPNTSNVKLAVYDLTGKEVAAIVNQELQPGRYEYKFDGSNLASGMYFYKITAGSFSVVKKMALIK